MHSLKIEGGSHVLESAKKVQIEKSARHGRTDARALE
jgi:hypothetical protein